MSKFIIKNFTSRLNYYLDRIKPGASVIYNRHFTTDFSEPIKFTHVVNLPMDATSKLSEVLLPKYKKLNLLQSLDLKFPCVMQTRAMDVEVSEADKLGQFIIASKGDVTVHYGNTGISPSASAKPKDLLKYQLEIPRESLGVLETKHHTPFFIEARDPENTFVVVCSDTVKIPEYDVEEIKKRCSMNCKMELGEDLMNILSTLSRDRILNDPNRESFYEETTLVIRKPSFNLNSSATYMIFKDDEIENSTSSHYHPGDRILEVFTTNKKSGVVLNFCGINENPENRKDCEVHLDFPPNSLITVEFPAYCHHKFYGDFVCVSIHPQDGPNIIDAVKRGTLPKGFLESATVFSSTEKESQWTLNAPQQNTSQDNDKKQSRDR